MQRETEVVPQQQWPGPLVNISPIYSVLAMV